jgi:hypothetical protein
MASLRNLAALFGALLPVALAAPTPRAPESIPNKYIITLKSDVDASTAKSHLSWVNEVHSRSLYKRELAGVEDSFDIGNWHAYVGEFDEATIEEIKNNPEASYTLSAEITIY